MKSNYFRKAKGKLLFEITNLRESVIRHLGMFDTDLVVFEGGLGSQLFAYFECLALEAEGVKAKTNFDYYLCGEQRQAKELSSYRKWALDRYGIPLEGLMQNSDIKNKARRMPSNLLFDYSPDRLKRYNSLNLKDRFRIDSTLAREFLEGLSISNDFYAIHLRRGDYLNVSSKLVTDEQVLSISKKVFSLLDRAPILVFSDSVLQEDMLNKLRVISNFEVIPIDQGVADDFLCHDLMRLAKVLIVSNSTYSLSAAILAERQQLAILPTEFYSGYREEAINKLIQRLSDFMILS